MEYYNIYVVKAYSLVKCHIIFIEKDALSMGSYVRNETCVYVYVCSTLYSLINFLN